MQLIHFEHKVYLTILEKKWLQTEKTNRNKNPQTLIVFCNWSTNQKKIYRLMLNMNSTSTKRILFAQSNSSNERTIIESLYVLIWWKSTIPTKFTGCQAFQNQAFIFFRSIWNWQAIQLTIEKKIDMYCSII